MRVEPLIALILVGLLFLSTNDQGPIQQEGATGNAAAGMDRWPAVSDRDLFGIDYVQRTCALEVVLGPFIMEGVGPVCRSLDGVLDREKVAIEEPMIACRPAADPTGTGSLDLN